MVITVYTDSNVKTIGSILFMYRKGRSSRNETSQFVDALSELEFCNRDEISIYKYYRFNNLHSYLISVTDIRVIRRDS